MAEYVFVRGKHEGARSSFKTNILLSAKNDIIHHPHIQHRVEKNIVLNSFDINNNNISNKYSNKANISRFFSVFGTSLKLVGFYFL